VLGPPQCPQCVFLHADANLTSIRLTTSWAFASSRVSRYRQMSWSVARVNALIGMKCACTRCPQPDFGPDVGENWRLEPDVDRDARNSVRASRIGSVEFAIRQSRLSLCLRTPGAIRSMARYTSQSMDAIIEFNRLLSAYESLTEGCHMGVNSIRCGDPMNCAPRYGRPGRERDGSEPATRGLHRRITRAVRVAPSAVTR